MTKLLRVTGRNFACGAIFEKRGGEWKMIICAPYLRRIIGRTPVAEIGALLRRKGFRYEWR